MLNWSPRPFQPSPVQTEGIPQQLRKNPQPVVLKMSCSQMELRQQECLSIQDRSISSSFYNNLCWWRKSTPPPLTHHQPHCSRLFSFFFFFSAPPVNLSIIPLTRSHEHAVICETFQLQQKTLKDTPCLVIMQPQCASGQSVSCSWCVL